MLGSLLSRVIIIGAGLLYPAYSSFKTIRSANVKHYVRWMMYWTVFALFSAAEWVADFWISWLPFYYEIKVLLVIWLMSSYTKGASVIYRRILHPLLSRRELEIDEWIDTRQKQSVNAVIEAGRKGVQAAANGALSGASGLLNTNANGTETSQVNPGLAAASGMMGSLLNMAQSAVTSTSVNTATTPNSQDADETFETIDETEIISTSEELTDESDDGDYEPPPRRSTRSKKKD